MLQEAQLIFDVLVPPPDSIEPKTSSSLDEIILRRRVKVKLTESNNELKRELDGIMKSLSKLEQKMSRWISDENDDFDELESVLSRRRQIKRTQKKFDEIHFYDDSDDEDFIDVEPDKNEAELLYMQLELDKKEPKKKPIKRKGNGF